MGTTVSATNEINKLHLEAMVFVAITNIPRVDPGTLNRFLELVTAGGATGTVSQEQILSNMKLILQETPGASLHSLLILMDLLEIKTTGRAALTSFGSARFDGINTATPRRAFGRSMELP